MSGALPVGRGLSSLRIIFLPCAGDGGLYIIASQAVSPDVAFHLKSLPAPALQCPTVFPPRTPTLLLSLGYSLCGCQLIDRCKGNMVTWFCKQVSLHDWPVRVSLPPPFYVADISFFLSPTSHLMHRRRQC